MVFIFCLRSPLELGDWCIFNWLSRCIMWDNRSRHPSTFEKGRSYIMDIVIAACLNFLLCYLYSYIYILLFILYYCNMILCYEILILQVFSLLSSKITYTISNHLKDKFSSVVISDGFWKTSSVWNPHNSVPWGSESRRIKWSIQGYFLLLYVMIKMHVWRMHRWWFSPRIQNLPNKWY